MTKLTKEQIEQERVKFEVSYKNRYPFNYHDELILRTDGNYRDRIAYEAFYWWLARAEQDKGE